MAINATFGTIEYRDGGVIAVPVTFAENVIAASKSIFEITHVSGDALTDMEYRLIGQNTAFKLIFEVPPDRSGSFQIAANGDVFKVSSGTWENVVNSQAVADRTFSYSTLEPRIMDYDIPENYTPGEIFDVILQYEEPVTLSPLPQGSTSFLDHFIFEGADLGHANIYRKTDDVYPTLPITDPLPAEWVNTDLTTASATIYLIRFPKVNQNATGIFNMTLRPGSVRGPVS